MYVSTYETRRCRWRLNFDRELAVIGLSNEKKNHVGSLFSVSFFILPKTFLYVMYSDK